MGRHRLLVALTVSLAGLATQVVAAGPAGATDTEPLDVCAGVDPGAVVDVPLLDALPEITGLSSFAAAIGAAGLDDDLSGSGPYTVFAPTNAAIDAIPQNVFDSLVADEDLLAALIGYHVVVGSALSSAALVEAGDVVTLGGTVEVTSVGGVPALDGEPVSCGDIAVANGVIHVIGHVLQPPTDPVACGPSSSGPPSSVSPSSVPGSSVPC